MADDLQNNKNRNQSEPEWMPKIILTEEDEKNTSNSSNTTPKSNSEKTESEDSTKKYTETQQTTQTVDANKNVSQAEKKPLPSKNRLEIINVIRDYDWTYSRDKNRKINEIPYITLKEFKIAANSYVSSLMTSTLLFPDVLTGNVDAAKGIANTAKTVYQKLESTFQNNDLGKFMKNISSAVGGATDFAKQQMSNISEMAMKSSKWAKEQFLDQTANEWGADKQDLIDNYQLLYLRHATERSYVFPYFENTYANIQNVYADSYESTQTPAQQSLKQINDLIQSTAKYIDFGSAAEPGMYIQRPKFYDFDNSSYSINVNFYLFNTITPNSYVDNMRLITKLLIQNTPHRYNRILVDPPCIYELTVPGRGFYPYTYIQEFSVIHHGTKRVMESGGKRIIVPDAFEIKMKIASLTTEVNNFMIPETGSAGINVSKRYGFDTLKLIGDAAESVASTFQDKIVTKPTEAPPKKQDPVEEAQTKQAQQVDTPQKAAKLFNETKNFQAAVYMGQGSAPKF